VLPVRSANEIEKQFRDVGGETARTRFNFPVNLAQGDDILLKVKRTILLTSVYCCLIFYDKYNNVLYKIDT
jgi:hypothetical protein